MSPTPSRWQTVNLGQIIGRLEAGVSVNAEDRPLANGELGVLKTSSVTAGVFRPMERKAVLPSEISRVKESPQAGGIIICRKNTLDMVGTSAYVEEDLPNLYLSDLLWQAVVSNPAKIAPRWLAILLASEHIRRIFKERATGTSGSMKNLSKGILLSIKVLCPPFEEQILIADFINRWDRAIDLTEKLLTEKQDLRAGLMHQLLTGKRRLPRFTKPWRTIHLGEAVRNRVESNRTDLPLLSIAADRGVIPRGEIDRKDSSSEDKSKYLRICPGDIGYNTMRMWQGVSGLSSLEGIVSPAYTVVTPKKGIDGEFMSLLFKSLPVVHLFCRYSQGLVSDTWNLKFRHFAEIMVTVPEEAEQKAIANAFRSVNRELELLQAKADALREQKKGLMQQLLTGKKRVTTCAT